MPARLVSAVTEFGCGSSGFRALQVDAFVFLCCLVLVQPGIQLEDLPSYAFHEAETFGELFEMMMHRDHKIPLALYRQ